MIPILIAAPPVLDFVLTTTAELDVVFRQRTLCHFPLDLFCVHDQNRRGTLALADADERYAALPAAREVDRFFDCASTVRRTIDGDKDAVERWARAGIRRCLLAGGCGLALAAMPSRCTRSQRCR